MTGNYIVFTFDIEHFQLKIFKKTRALAYRQLTEFISLPEVLKIYEPFETTLCKYYINETGQVVSFYKILQTLSEDGLFEFYKNYDEENDIEKTHKKVLKDIKSTFGASIEPDSVSLLSVDKFENEKIKWDHYRIFNNKFQTFLECQFIYQLNKSFDKNLMNYQKDHNSYYHNKIMWSLSPSLFSVVNPRDFILNDDEVKEYTIFYNEWELTSQVKNLSEKFNFLMLNSTHKNDKSKQNQKNILNFFLLSITIVSTINLIPILDKIFRTKINQVLYAQVILFLALVIFLVLFYKPIKSVTRKIYYWVKNVRTHKRITRNKI